MAPLIAGLSLASYAASTCEAINYSCKALESPAVERAGRATVMVRIPGASQCTGTLVNNGREDGRPFILTARHCAEGGDLVAQAAAMEIVYDHQVGCDGVPAQSRSTIGAIHRAVFGDLWLVEALDPPPVADTYFAGINASGTYGNSYFGVHHGNGQVKQYVEQSVISGNLVYLVDTLLDLVISTWHTSLQLGTTPPGSSGSALFDSDARVFGTLSAGVGCAGDPNGNEYQQLNAAWAPSKASESLRAWLDPDSTGFLTLSGKATPAGDTATTPSGEESGQTASDTAGGGAWSGFWMLALLGLRRWSERRAQR